MDRNLKIYTILGVVIASGVALVAFLPISPFAVISSNEAIVCFDSKFKNGNLFCRGGSFERSHWGSYDNYIRLDKAGYKIYREIYGEPSEGDMADRYKLSEQGKNKVEASFIKCDLWFDVDESYDETYGQTYEMTTNNSRLAFKNQRREHYFAFCPLDGAPQIDYDSFRVNLIINKDKDGDGVYNYGDDCPEIYGNDPQGCPLNDQDNDGVYDRNDNCPDEAGSGSNGCPNFLEIIVHNLFGWAGLNSWTM